MATAEAVRERPILFSGPMVRALLAGTKTQTRRIVKPQPVSTPHGFRFGVPGIKVRGVPGERIVLDNMREQRWIDDCCPYGAPGDALYVREALMAVKDTTISPEEIMPVCAYRADGAHLWERDQVRVPWQWQRSTLPAIHCPRWASRITLRVTSVRVERLHAITEEDARAEGLDGDCPIGSIPAYEKSPCVYHFAQLWETINGVGSWAADPFVWVVGLEREPAP